MNAIRTEVENLARDMYVTGAEPAKARFHRPTCKRVNAGLAFTVGSALEEGTGRLVYVQEARPASCCKPRPEWADAAHELAFEVMEPEAAPAEPEVAQDDESDPLAGDDDPQTDYTAKAFYSSSKAPRYFWRVMSRRVAPLVAERFGVRTEVLPRSYAVVIHAESKDAAVEAADYLVGLWRTCSIAVKSWRKTSEEYQALPEKGSKWFTSARFRAEEEHIEKVAQGTLDTL